MKLILLSGTVARPLDEQTYKLKLIVHKPMIQKRLRSCPGSSGGVLLVWTFVAWMTMRMSDYEKRMTTAR